MSTGSQNRRKSSPIGVPGPTRVSVSLSAWDSMGYHYRMLLLNNEDVARLLTVDDCIEVLDEAYREWGEGRAAQFPPGPGFT